MKIPIYEKQVREVGGAKMPSAPLLSGAPISQGSEISKIASNLLNVTGGLMEKYNTKLNDQEKMNIADKYYIDYSQDHTALIQSSTTSQQIIDGMQELDKKYATRASESKYPNELNHLYATLKVPNDKKLSNLAFSMKSVEAKNDLIDVIQNATSSDIPTDKKREFIEATLRNGIANLTIDKAFADKKMATFDHDVEYSDLYKIKENTPEYFFEQEDPDDPTGAKMPPIFTKEDFKHVTEQEFDSIRSKAKVLINDKRIKIDREQAETYNKEYVNLMRSKNDDGYLSKAENNFNILLNNKEIDSGQYIALNNIITGYRQALKKNKVDPTVDSEYKSYWKTYFNDMILNGSNKQEQEKFIKDVTNDRKLGKISQNTWENLVEDSRKYIPEHNRAQATKLINKIKSRGKFSKGEIEYKLGKVATGEKGFFGGKKYRDISTSDINSIIESINRAIKSDATITDDQINKYFAEIDYEVDKIEAFDRWLKVHYPGTKSKADILLESINRIEDFHKWIEINHPEDKSNKKR